MIRKYSVNHMLQIGLMLSQFLPGTLLTVEAGQLIYENTFNNSWGATRKKTTPRIPSSCEASAYSLVPDPADGANQVSKLFQVGDSSCLSSEGKHRTQIFLTDVNTDKLLSLADHTHYFVAHRVYIPASFPAQWLSSNKEMFAYFYVTRSLGGTVTPALLLTGNGSTPILRAVRRYIDAGGEKHAFEQDIVLKTGWNTIIYHVKYEWDNTGVWKLWLNGDLKINENGVPTATDPAIVPGGATMSVGPYWGYLNRPDDVLIYVDDIRIASGSDGFDLVNPGGELSTAPPTTPANLLLFIND